MRIAFLGTGDFGVPALRAMRVAGHAILVAISQPDRAAGRGKQIRATPIHALCDELGIRHQQSADVNTSAPFDLLRVADIGVVAAFGQKLGARVLSGPRLGCVNIHASLLPRHRGAAPYQWAILNGDATTGVTVFQINERWDAGPIWGTRKTPIGETETADELHDRLALLGAELIVETLAAIEGGTATPRVQDVAQATRAPKLTKADGCVDFAGPARMVARRINGMWSWPAATCTLYAATGKSERVQLARAQAESGAANSAPSPGSFRPDGLVQCGDGAVRILEIRPAGGKLMSFDAFARGRDIRPPARLETPVLDDA